MEKLTAARLTPANLAFIGDAVHTLFVRERVLMTGIAGTGQTTASRYVNAVAQARAFDRLAAAEFFSEDEWEIARRAKNAHLHSRAKTASLEDYHKATALEAVIGYLHLIGDGEREAELLQKAMEFSAPRG